MIHLVSKVNGVAALLFHVEQQEQTSWHWRWRIVGDHPLPYLAWREGVSRSPRVIFHPEIAGCVVEAQWRATESDPWLDATLRETSRGTARFRVKSLDAPFTSPVGFSAVAVTQESMIACYGFGPMALAAGEEQTVTGIADGPFADNVLLQPGEFVTIDPRLEIVNLTPSADSFTGPSTPLARLSRMDGSHARRLFAWRGHGVTPTPSLP